MAWKDGFQTDMKALFALGLMAAVLAPAGDGSDMRVEYFDLSDMDSVPIPSSPVALPESLDPWMVKVSISNPDRFHSEVLTLADRLGYGRERIARLKPRELVELSSKIVGKKLRYHDVDHDRTFIEEYGKDLPVDDYFHIGKGDCDKYADLTIAIFNLLKPPDPRLRNVHLTRNFGGNALRHAWVAIVVPESPGKISMSHIDPTNADNGGQLEANPVHVNRRFFEFRCLSLMNYRTQSNRVIGSLLQTEERPRWKAELLSSRAFNYVCLDMHLEAARDYEAAAHLVKSKHLKSIWFRNACEGYYKQGADWNVIAIVQRAKKDELERAFAYTAILASGIASAKRMGETALQQKYLDELLSEFPDDVYAREFK